MKVSLICINICLALILKNPVNSYKIQHLESTPDTFCASAVMEYHGNRPHQTVKLFVSQLPNYFRASVNGGTVHKNGPNS